MKPRHLAGPAFLAFICLLLLTAGAAMATEGPFHKVEGKRLSAKETKSIETAAANEYIMMVATAGITIRCKKQSTAGGQIVGSTGANAGTEEGTVTSSECTVTGNGEKCQLVGGAIKTEPVRGTLAYSHAKSEKAEVLLQIVTPAKGAVFAKVQFEGASCKIKETLFEGSIGAEVWGSSGKPVKLEEGEGEGPGGQINFPATSIKSAWTESEGVRKENKLALKAFGAACIINGRSEGKLVSKEKGGVFTK